MSAQLQSNHHEHARSIEEQYLEYWEHLLKGEMPILQLLTDRPLSHAKRLHFGLQPFSLPREASECLNALSQLEGTSPTLTLLAAFIALLRRYTNQPEIIVGTLGLKHASAALGSPFTDVLPIQTELAGSINFHEVLKRTLLAYQAAHTYPAPSPNATDGDWGTHSYLSATALFSVMFVVKPRSQFALPIQGLTNAGQPVSWADITLMVDEGDAAFTGQIQYNSDLFDDKTISRLIGHFQILLKNIAAAPTHRLATLPSLTEHERHTLLEEWNDTRSDFPAEKCLPALFEEQVERTPEAVAVVFEGRTLTFAELNRQANQLAHYLCSIGVNPEVRIALCVDRSPEMLVCLLAILKAGGVYVPLDPTYPHKRLEFMLADAAPLALLTQSHLLDQLPPSEAKIICLDQELDTLNQFPTQNLPPRITPNNLAYMIYTSGSTGVPKGTQIPHQALVNFLTSMRRKPGLEVGEVLLSVTSLSFDIAALELFLPLVVGGRVVLVSRATALNGIELQKVLATSGATMMQATPATWRLLLATNWPGQAGLRILCGGDVLTTELAEQLLTRSDSLWNMYGPTETTVWSTCVQVKSGELLTVGRPIANTEVYVLDAFLQPVPVGVVGTLYIGGLGLARGYFGHPELTAERFIPHPFAAEPGRRLYNTGDYVRYHQHGQIEFLGRQDHQVKIRGHRIELTEIESVLRKHPAVAEAVVVAHSTTEDKRIVAYIVSRTTPPPTATELRNFLEGYLPRVMLPTALIPIPALPLTPNGKIDRLALPQPDFTQRVAEQTITAPRTLIESELINIWAEVLGLSNPVQYTAISITDSFMDLGGDSLQATQVWTRVCATFQVELPLSMMFEALTVADCATRIEAARSAGPTIQTSPILPSPHTGTAELSFSQKRLWFLDRLTPHNPAYHLPVTLRLVGALSVASLKASLIELVRRHATLRTSFSEREGRPMQVIKSPLDAETCLPFTVINLQTELETERESLLQNAVMTEALRPFDLAQGPLVRVYVFQLAPTEHVVLLAMHHIITDGWSTGVLADELMRLYEAMVSGSPLPLPALPIQYADFAVWQNEYLQGPARQRHMAYWRKHLADLPAALNLPSDRPRSTTQTPQSAFAILRLDRDLTQRLNQLERQAGGSLFMALLAGLQILLYRYTGSADIAVGTLIANRTHLELEKLIGYFINTLVLRTDLSGGPTVQELLARVRQVALHAFAHQATPIEMILEELHPERHLGHTPFIQVMLVVQNYHVPPLTFAGLTGELAEVRIPALGTFDMMLWVEEAPEATINLTAEYNEVLFDAETIQRLLEHYRCVLSALTTDLNQPIALIPLLSATERQTLNHWTGLGQGDSQARCIHTLFEAQARQVPEAVAVLDPSTRQHLTYAELNRRANQLAHRLQALHVGPETRVGIYLQRSPELLVAVLAVLKAGGAYVPLDTQHPPERLRLIVSDANAQIIITQEQLRQKLAWDGARYVCLDTDDLAHENATNVESHVSAQNMAYVIYTSGSTGKPKGVIGTHEALVSAYLAWEQAYALNTIQSHLQMASFSFDVFTGDWVRALCSGARLILCARDTLLDPQALYQLLQREQVECGEFVPAVIKNLVRYLPTSATLDFMRLLIVGSEAWSIGDYQRVQSLCGPQTRLINSYGLTEMTIDSSFFSGTTLDLAAEATIPIGRPLINTQLYILDSSGQPCPIGIPGELYIGGSGITRGYLGEPTLTAARFVPDPFSPIPGARLYKTGDQARYLADGNVDFLGRIDSQVKIRGFRIELGEIQAALRQYPNITEAVVVAQRETASTQRDPYLIAYVVLKANARLEDLALRQFLAQKLPDYMIPAGFIQIETIPMTASGKVNFQALPKATETSPEENPNFIAPETEVEKIVAEVWAEVLGLEQISLSDNFFDLGGHSLLAIQVIYRLNTILQTQFSVGLLFEEPTLLGLALRIEEHLIQDLQTEPAAP